MTSYWGTPGGYCGNFNPTGIGSGTLIKCTDANTECVNNKCVVKAVVASRPPSKVWVGPQTRGWNSDTQCPRFSEFRADNADACKVKCEDNARCNAIHYNTSTQHCALIDCPSNVGAPSLNFAGANVPIVMYSTFQELPPPTKTWNGPSKIGWTQAQCPNIGGDRATATTTLENCKSMCEATPQCNSIDYRTTPSRQCFLRACPPDATEPLFSYRDPPSEFNMYATFPFEEEEMPEPPPEPPADPPLGDAGDNPPPPAGNDPPPPAGNDPPPPAGNDPPPAGAPPPANNNPPPPENNDPPVEVEPNKATFYEKNKAAIIGGSIGGGVLLLLIIILLIVSISKKR